MLIKKTLKNGLWPPAPPGKNNWPPDKNLASGGRAGAKFLSGDQFFWSGGPGGPGGGKNIIINGEQ